MVGVDGSSGSEAAIKLAAWEAQRRQVPLVLVHGYVDRGPSGTYGWIPRASVPAGSPQDQARAMLTQLQQRVQGEHPALTVRSTMIAAGGAAALVELSTMASLVVTGSRGSGGFAGLLIGSVSAQVAAHARTPVIVARPVPDETVGGESGPMPPPGRVVVGIDGSAESANALMFALDEAHARKAPLTAMFVWWNPPSDILSVVTDPDHAQSGAEHILDDIVSHAVHKFPEVDVSREAAHELNTAHALIEASVGAGLMVVGSRGRGGFTSLLLGSVSRAVLGHAQCPVAIVRTQT